MDSSVTILFGCGVKSPQFTKYSNRVKSFETWSTQIKQDKYTLARAGFFYTNHGDVVECFACGVQICEWTYEDLPEVEHERHSFHCMYMALAGNIRHMCYDE